MLAPFGTLLLSFDAQNYPLGCPAKVPKKRSRNTYVPARNFQAKGYKMGRWNRKVGDILTFIFQFDYESFWVYLWLCCVIVLGHDFGYFYALFGCLRVFSRNQPIWQKMQDTITGASFLRFRHFVLFCLYFMTSLFNFGIDSGMHFGSFGDRVLEVKRLPKWHQDSMRN